MGPQDPDTKTGEMLPFCLCQTRIRRRSATMHRFVHETFDFALLRADVPLTLRTSYSSIFPMFDRQADWAI